MPADITNRINAYALTAGCFLMLNKQVDGQVIYTDLEPDIQLDSPGQEFELDIDNNGTIDAWFHNNSFLFYSVLFGSTQTIQDIIVGPESTLNSIAGNSVYISMPYGGFTRNYAYAINLYSPINNALQWHNFDFDVMALRTFYHNGEDTLLCLQCYWYSYYNSETIDHFVAIRFKSEDSNFHYGWIRCDVLDEGRVLVLKDYAYESIPDLPIIAGDTIQYSGISQVSPTKFNLNIHPIPATDHIIIDYPASTPTTLNIYTSSGAIIYHNPHWTGEAIDISNFPPAMYYLQLLQPEQVGYGCFVKE